MIGKLIALDRQTDSFNDHHHEVDKVDFTIEPRRDWIEQNVDFTMEDDYEI